MLLIALTACGGEVAATTTASPKPTTTTATTIGLTGTVDLPIGGFDGDRETLCWGQGGYEDLTEGANVVALDGDGNTLGVGDLGRGEYHIPPDGEWSDTTCRFIFEVDLIGEAPFYTVEVAGREAPTFTHADLEADGWHIELSLG